MAYESAKHALEECDRVDECQSWANKAAALASYATSGLFLVCYSLARSAIEFVRVPDVQIGYFAGDWLTMGQLLSLPMLLAGVVLLVIAWRRREPSGNYRGS